MRIAIVINTSWNIYNFRLGMIKAFQAEGHEVITIAPLDEYSDKLKEEGCTYEPLMMYNKQANPFLDLLLLFRLFRLYKKHKPDIILHYTIKPNIYGSLAARLVSIPCINNVSGLGTLFLRKSLASRVGMFLYKVSFLTPKKVFFQNTEDQRLFIDLKLVKHEQVGLLPGSGVDLSRFVSKKTTPNAPMSFLFLARMIYDKGIIEYIEAIRIVRKNGSTSRFLLCGFIETDAGLGVSLQKIKEWESEGLVTYLGPSSHVEEVIETCDCVVLPSYREGTSKSLLEAAAMSRPIVTTDVPGCRDVVIDGENGLLCNVKDSIHLAQKITEMEQVSVDTWRSMGMKGRERVEKYFSQEIVIKKYKEVINSILCN